MENFESARKNQDLAASPVSVQEFELLKKSVLFTQDDVHALKKSHDVLRPQVDEILSVWYGFVGANAHLLESFSHQGEPNAHYLEAVKKRFGQWILDTANANYDEKWLEYQYEIGLRHHRIKKNQTDGVKAAAHIPFRHLVALTYPITATLKPFLEKNGHSAAEVDAMHQAWIKSVLMQVILWSQPYIKEGDF